MHPSPQLMLGRVLHRRLRPRIHAFAYPVFFVSLPLRRLATANCAIFSVGRWNLLSFHDGDHGPRDGTALLPWIESLLREHGLPHDGEIILQAFPRVLGWVFNPVSFWYCHDRSGALIAVLAEVNNTFGGSHNYLLHNPDGAPLADDQELRADKQFHVSPFNKIVGAYRFRFDQACAQQVARIDYHDDEGPLLLTALVGEPHPWTAGTLWLAFLRMPFLTAGVMFRIHWQALKLWLKGVPFHGTKAAPPNRKPVQ